jgi:glycosyltransferase involved in cell wall biosynthesis
MPVEGFEVNPLRKRTYRIMDRLTEPFVGRFIVVSESVRQILVAERQISTERVVKVYNGVELDQFYPATRKSTLRKAWGIGADEIVIGSVGRLVWQKGFEYLLRAIPKITENQPNSRFLFVGEGPLRNRLEDLAKSLNILQKVIFTGFLAEVNEVLANIDVLVIPSVLEGFPMVTLEAMAMQKPIVATHIPGISEQISDGEEGILVPPKDPRALAQAILLLAKDKELASKVGNSARQSAEKKFSVEKMVAETEKVYRCILNDS